MVLKLFDMMEYPPNQVCGRLRIVQRDEIRNRVEVSERWLGPQNYSHRAMTRHHHVNDDGVRRHDVQRRP